MCHTDVCSHRWVDTTACVTHIWSTNVSHRRVFTQVRAGAVCRGRPKEFQWTLETFCLEFSSGVLLLTNCAHRGWQRFGFSQNPVACPSAVFGQTPVRASAIRRGIPKELSEWRSQQDAKDSHAGQTREATSSQTEYGHPRLARPPIEHSGPANLPCVDRSVARPGGADSRNAEWGVVDGSVCRDPYPVGSVDRRVARHAPFGERRRIKSPAAL